MRDKNGCKKIQQPLHYSYFVAEDYFAKLEFEVSNDCLNTRRNFSTNMLFTCIGYEFHSMKLSL